MTFKDEFFKKHETFFFPPEILQCKGESSPSATQNWKADNIKVQSLELLVGFISSVFVVWGFFLTVLHDSKDDAFC